jgi:hypothetical protein
MLCPKCKQGKIVSMVTVARALPLAKGGGVATTGFGINKDDLVAAHRANLKSWVSPRKGKTEIYFEVSCDNEGLVQMEEPDPNNPGQMIVVEKEAEFCAHPFWYFPTGVDSEGNVVPGRGLTWVNGRDLSQPEHPVVKAAKTEEDPGMIAPDGEATGEGVEGGAAPAVPAKKAIVRRRAPAFSIPAAG